MAFVVQPIATDIADDILTWCGVTSPTPQQVAVAELAARFAQNTIRHYRQLDVAEPWQANRLYALRDVVQPSRPNGHLYICTTAGTSDDDTEPTWDADTDSTTTDGTVVWTEYVRPFETEYNDLAVEMGVYLYQKRGVDGTTAFSENGIQRSFEKGSFPPSMLARIKLPVKTG